MKKNITQPDFDSFREAITEMKVSEYANRIHGFIIANISTITAMLVSLVSLMETYYGALIMFKGMFENFIHSNRQLGGDMKREFIDPLRYEYLMEHLKDEYLEKIKYPSPDDIMLSDDTGWMVVHEMVDVGFCPEIMSRVYSELIKSGQLNMQTIIDRVMAINKV
jgi:hypothetical protein